MTFDVNLTPKQGDMRVVCPNCGAELNVDWRDFDDKINGLNVYHLFCERCDVEIYAHETTNDARKQREDLLIPIDEFRELVDYGAFIDSDGSGYYAAEHWTSRIEADLEDVLNGNYPEWVRYVEWYNK